MKTAVLFKNILAILAVVLLTTPCFGEDLKIQGAPNWVNSGSIYTTVQGERLFYGVGIAPPVGDRELQRVMVESRARRAVGRLLSAWLNTLATDYIAAAKKDNRPVDGKVVSQQFKSVGKAALPQAKLVARWKQRETGVLHGMFQLDMNTVKKIADSHQEIDASVRAYLQTHGDEAFDRLSKQ